MRNLRSPLCFLMISNEFVHSPSRYDNRNAFDLVLHSHTATYVLSLRFTLYMLKQVPSFAKYERYQLRTGELHLPPPTSMFDDLGIEIHIVP